MNPAPNGADSAADTSWRKIFRRLHGELTASEQRAGEYFEVHPEAAYRSISEVVADSEIGYGTIIRFCQKLGCKGFQEFKLLLVTDDAANDRSKDDQGDHSGSEAARRLKSDLSETLRLLDEEGLQRSAQQILGSRVTLVGGVASSAPLALSLAWKLCRIGIDARPSTEGYVMAVNATLLGNKDVLFAISSSGATKDILHSAEVAKNQGATVIALTNFSSSPLSQLADTSLFTAATRDPIKAEIPSIIAGEAVLEMLLEKLLAIAPERRDHLIQSSRVVSDRKL
ncbi:MurR/RpiR family transcriptional regulator [Blastopirellula marina]|uniref:MurR/RpiR family transcriptional regulator n=1 Tax=Blastopirellula marina TaxID=124 RepID=A0A2S8F2V4_9BACT|nr:MurR/RpiR family transcriptional regulator [Blastopirellula marina]PQO26479.1 hypothetical protein C5Y98_30540 [Blastopirellula marina]PTL40792.1 MurR/RpiR family transcriptional regulator [Blastopirellula marina]